MDLGHGHRRSVVILWTWTLLLSAFVLYPTLTGRNPTYLPFGIIALAIVLFTVLHPSVRARRREADQTGPDPTHVDESAETLVEGLPPTGSDH
jgi:UDP-GlcNAc:undecaprenyl-phosphate GlcNAc-1-phosphate transferase